MFMQRRCVFNFSCHEARDTEGGAVLLSCRFVWLFCRSIVPSCRLLGLFCRFIGHFCVSTGLFCIFVGFVCTCLCGDGLSVSLPCCKEVVTVLRICRFVGLFGRFVGLFCVRVERFCTRLCGGGVSSSLSCSEKGGAVLLICRLLQRWRRCTGCHVFTLYFKQKSRIISGSFAKNDLPLKASYGPCSRTLLLIHRNLFRLAGHFCGSIHRNPFRLVGLFLFFLRALFWKEPY